MKLLRYVALIMVLSFLLLAVTCPPTADININRPEGFAEYKSRYTYKAISPEGIILRIRTVANYPEMDIEFWGKALKNHLIKEGYVLLTDDQSFSTANQEGILFEWGAPYDNQDYIFLTALIVYGQRIIIVEATGEHTIFKQYRPDIIESMQSIALKSSQ